MRGRSCNQSSPATPGWSLGELRNPEEHMTFFLNKIYKHLAKKKSIFFIISGPVHWLLKKKVGQWAALGQVIVLKFSIDYFWVPYLLSGISSIISFLEVVSQMSKYLIFVSFGIPPHYLARLQYTKKCVNSQQNSRRLWRLWQILAMNEHGVFIAKIPRQWLGVNPVIRFLD